MSHRAILTFILVVYGVSWSIQGLAIWLTPGIGSDAAEPFLLLTMLVPTVVTAAWLLKAPTLRPRVLWRPSWRMLWMALLGVLIPTLVAFAVVALLAALGYGLSGWFTVSPSGVAIAGGPWLLGTGMNGWAHFVANVVATAITFSLISGIPAAAEELAWRGFLQGVLIDKLGLTRGVLVLGLVWSFWHLPALLAGYNHPEHPLLGSFVLQPIQEIAVSFFLAWLTLSCRSFIPAALAHGAGNSIQEGVISNVVLSAPSLNRDLVTLAITAAVGLVAWCLLSRQQSQAV